MENKKIYCTSKDHENLEASLYCQEWQIYICKKCDKLHSGLFQTHHIFKLDKDIKDIFTGFCKIENHNNKLEYFCKDHCTLCCGLCFTKIKGKDKWQHTDCNTCLIEEIKDEKNNQLTDNIKCLEDLNKTLDESINQLKKISEQIKSNKEELKLYIMKIFDKIKQIVTERETEILSVVDKQFDDLYFNEEIIKQSEKIPKKIKKHLENGKLKEDD